MDEFYSPPVWENPPVNSWEDMLNDLLQDPEPGTEIVGSADCQQLESVDVSDFLQGLLTGGCDDADDNIGFGAGLKDGNCWTNSLLFDAACQPELPIRLDAGCTEDELCVPSLSSEVSSFVEDDRTHLEDSKSTGENFKIDQHQGISSPGSCCWADGGHMPSSNSDDEVGNASSHSNSPNESSCFAPKAASPDTGSDSSEVGARGRSCDNFASQPVKAGTTTPAKVDEDLKRLSRLERNRESASQSRLRKKSYVKDLEAKCRAMEAQLTMLHQTVAYTSSQNIALREELAHFKCLNASGSKSGVTEPAALPSDSLPSESPSRHTFQCRSVKWELVAFLCHVLLLTHLLALHLKLAPSGERFLSKTISEGRNFSIASRGFRKLRKSAKSSRDRVCSSNRRGRRCRKGFLRVPRASPARFFKLGIGDIDICSPNIKPHISSLRSHY